MLKLQQNKLNNSNAWVKPFQLTIIIMQNINLVCTAHTHKPLCSQTQRLKKGTCNED